MLTCVVCKQGETRAGTTTLALDRAGTVLVVREIPADVCENCGEAYLSGTVVQELERMFDVAARNRVSVEVRSYAA